MITESYFDTLAQVRESIEARLLRAKAELRQRNFFSDSMESFREGVNYNQTVTQSTPLLTYKGRPTTRYAHAVIARCCSGRYELTFYIL